MGNAWISRTAFAVSLLFALALQGANAGLVFVSGDSNVTDSLAGSPNGNTIFFTNVLQGGTNVRVLDFTNANAGSAANTDSELLSFYNGLSGVSASAIVGTVTAASLAGVNLFLAPLPDDNFSAAEIAVMQAFLAGGGTLFFLGENNNAVFSTSNAAINSALSALGSGLSFIPDLVDAGFQSATGSQIASDTFTSGVTSFQYAATSRVGGGTQIFFGTQGEPFVTYSSVPEPGTLALLGLGLAGLAASRRRKH